MKVKILRNTFVNGEAIKASTPGRPFEELPDPEAKNLIAMKKAELFPEPEEPEPDDDPEKTETEDIPNPDDETKPDVPEPAGPLGKKGNPKRGRR